MVVPEMVTSLVASLALLVLTILASQAPLSRKPARVALPVRTQARQAARPER